MAHWRPAEELDRSRMRHSTSAAMDGPKERKKHTPHDDHRYDYQQAFIQPEKPQCSFAQLAHDDRSARSWWPSSL